MSSTNLLTILVVVMVALVAALAALAIWAPRKARIRAIALVLTAALLPLGYAGFAALLSRPKPASIEWAKRKMPQATVLASYLVEGKAIYLWLKLPGAKAPRFYQFPWSRKLAQRLVRAQQAAKRRGVRVQMRRPFGRMDDMVKSRFHVKGHRPMPAKRSGAGKPLIYRHPGDGT